MSDERKCVWLQWLKAASMRAIKTAAQVALIMLGGDWFNVLTVDWVTIIGFALSGAIVSMLTSLAGLPEAESPVRGEQ